MTSEKKDPEEGLAHLDDRLPPPAFPPGSAVRRPGVAGAREVSTLDDAFISPDAPIVRDGAPQAPDDFERVMGAAGEEEVVVTGIGDDTHLHLSGASGAPRPSDPWVAHLLEALEALTGSVQQKGEAGLRTSPSMSRFEATLRGYCVGYLAGLREDADRVANRSED